MVNLILQFVACARAAELRVSTAEVMDCLAQIRLVDLLDEKQVYAVLRANFAKSRREQRRFDHLYHLFFHELQVDADAAEAGSLRAHRDAIRESLKAVAGDHLELAAIADFIAGEPAPYLQLLQEIQTEGDSRRQGPGSNLGATGAPVSGASRPGPRSRTGGPVFGRSSG